MPSSGAVPPGNYYSCSAAQRWTFPLLSRMMGFLGREQPLVAEGGSGEQIVLGNKPLRVNRYFNFHGEDFSAKLGTWKCNVPGWENILFSISDEELAHNEHHGHCVTFLDRKVVQPFFNFFIHFREKWMCLSRQRSGACIRNNEESGRARRCRTANIVDHELGMKSNSETRAQGV
jgi:hypothetical protein